MPGPLGFNVFQSSGGGLLSGLGGTGILSTLVGPLQTRVATSQAAATPQAKVQALVGTLGARLKSGGLLGGLGLGGSSSSHAQPAMQVAGASRTFASPTTPAGISYR